MTDAQIEATEPEGEVEEAVEKMTFEAAHELIEGARKAWEDVYANVKACAAFEDGEQWAEPSQEELQLTYNIVPSFTNHASNIVKKCPPSIKILPSDDGDPNNAKAYDSLIDEIERKSHATSAYTSAFEQCVATSLGMFRVVLEEVDRKDEAGNKRKEPRIRAIRDTSSVLVDPMAEQPGLVDMEWFSISSLVPKKTYKREWKGAELDDFDSQRRDWFEDDTVRIAEFWFKDYSRDGKWTQWIISGKEILHKNETYPGKYSPLCVVHGRERVYDGKRTFECMTKRIMDPQRVLNSETTAWVQSLDGVGGFEWLATAKQIGGEYQPIWDSRKKRRYMPFNPDPAAGGAPIHAPAAAIPSALMQGSAMAAEAMQKILGIRDPMKDLPGSQSGKAIALQMSQTDVAIFGYQFALEVAKEHCGCVLVDLIPYLYNFPHVRSIRGKDGQVTKLPIMTSYREGATERINDLSQGNYEVIVSSGPTWESRKEETREMLGKLLQANPEWVEKWGDILVKALDFDGAEEAAARLRVGMDPALLEASNPTNGGDPATMAAVLQGKLRMASAQIEQLTQALQAETAEREKLQAGIDAKMQMQQADHQHAAQMNAAKSEDQMALAQMQAQIQAILKRMDIDGRAGLQESKAGIDSNARRDKAALDAEILEYQHAYGMTMQEAKAMQQRRLERVKFGHQGQLMVLDAQIETAYPGAQVDQEDI